MFSQDFDYCLSADGLIGHSINNWFRTTRRMLNRSYRERQLIQQSRVFCQNSGACGSSYIVQLLKDNRIERCFHEPDPDFNELGVSHYENAVSRSRLVRLLRYTRHDIFFEANNRLFSMSQELKVAFPNAMFIHLHRHPAEAVRSAMSKPDIESYLKNGPRFQGALAGPKSSSPFERCCHYWANVNRRIRTDLQGFDSLSLRFDDLIAGNLDQLESFLGVELPVHTRAAVNAGPVRNEGRFPKFAKWEPSQQERFEQICGSVMREMGYEAVGPP